MQTVLISVQVLKSLLLIMLVAMQEVALLMTSTILILEIWQGAKQIRKMTTSISISVAMAKVKAMRNKKKKNQLLAQVISWTYWEELIWATTQTLELKTKKMHKTSSIILLSKTYWGNSHKIRTMLQTIIKDFSDLMRRHRTMLQVVLRHLIMSPPTLCLNKSSNSSSRLKKNPNSYLIRCFWVGCLSNSSRWPNNKCNNSTNNTPSSKCMDRINMALRQIWWWEEDTSNSRILLPVNNNSSSRLVTNKIPCKIRDRIRLMHLETLELSNNSNSTRHLRIMLHHLICSECNLLVHNLKMISFYWGFGVLGF